MNKCHDFRWVVGLLSDFSKVIKIYEDIRYNTKYRKNYHWHEIILNGSDNELKVHKSKKFDV